MACLYYTNDCTLQSNHSFFSSFVIVFSLVSFASFSFQVLMQNTDLVSDFLVQFFYYLLLLYGFVPISLYVSQNFIRYFQASVVFFLRLIFGWIRSFFHEVHVVFAPEMSILYGFRAHLAPRRPQVSQMFPGECTTVVAVLHLVLPENRVFSQIRFVRGGWWWSKILS